MVSINYILGAAVSATLVSAHMELLWPAPLRSKYNSLTPQVDIGESHHFFFTNSQIEDVWTRADRQTTR